MYKLEKSHTVADKLKQLKQKYLEMRRVNSFDLNWFYDYYLLEYDRLSEEKGYKERLDRNEFFKVFQPVFSFNNGRILHYLDSKFSVTILTDSRGNEIKAL